MTYLQVVWDLCNLGLKNKKFDFIDNQKDKDQYPTGFYISHKEIKILTDLMSNDKLYWDRLLSYKTKIKSAIMFAESKYDLTFRIMSYTALDLTQNDMYNLVLFDPKSRINASLYTPREIQLIDLLAQGNSSKEIAEKVSISIKTVEVHRHNIMKKSGCKNSVDVVVKFYKEGLINL